MRHRIAFMTLLVVSTAVVCRAQQDWPWWPWNTFRKNALIYQNLLDHRAFTSAEEMLNDTSGTKILVTKQEIEGLITDIDYLMHSRCYHSVPRGSNDDPPECHVLSRQEEQEKSTILSTLNRALQSCWYLPRSSYEMGCYLR